MKDVMNSGSNAIADTQFQGVVDERNCFTCGRNDALARCCRCSAVWFCGPACQRVGWKAHKVHCLRFADGDRVSEPDEAGSGGARRTIELSNGVRMPALGLGTGGNPGLTGEQCRAVVSQALEVGYRCVDTAEMYGNHKEIGEAIQAADVSREEIFVITKLAPFSQGEDRAAAAVQRMRTELGLEVLDAVLVHWPGVWSQEQRDWSLQDWTQRAVSWAREHRLGTWRSLERLYKAGVVRSIGVSNYTIGQLEELASSCSVMPHLIQSEFHPYFTNAEVKRWCASKGIAFSAYAPLGGYITERNVDKRALDDIAVCSIAETLGRSPAQVVLRWAAARGVCPVPKTCKVDRLVENIDALSLDLNEAQLSAIDALDRERPLYWDAACVDKLDQFNPFLNRERMLAELDAVQGASREVPSGSRPSSQSLRARGSRQLWEVVGGGERGGILVREGAALTSPKTASRLSAGAKVEELELVGDRLHYRRRTGTGPDEGWVSIAINDKALVAKVIQTL